MSRVGNSNIEIPEGVTLKFVNGLFIAKGKLGELSLNINQNINIEIGEQVISLTRKNDSNSEHNSYKWNNTAGFHVSKPKVPELVRHSL